jgi:FkbM family methyltransferase
VCDIPLGLIPNFFKLLVSSYFLPQWFDTMAVISRKHPHHNHHHPSEQRSNRSTTIAICSSYVIASFQIALVVAAGSLCGFIVAALQALTDNGSDLEGSDNRPTTMWGGGATRSLSNMNHHNNPNNNNNNNNNCRMPPHTTKLTIPSNDGFFFDLVVWDDGDFLTETIKATGVWEILNLQGMAELGDTTLPETPGVFWDVGANIGYYSFLFAAAGYTVIAMEPELQNAELFRASLCLNPTLAPRMTLLPTAVTSTEHVAVSTSQRQPCRIVATTKAKRMKQYRHLIPRLVCGGNEGRCRRSADTICQDVTVTTLDTILKSYPPPDILKLDVEGHELAVLKGGPTVLSSNNKSKKNAPFMIQYENKDGRIEGEIATLLESYGYTIGRQRGHDSNTVASRKSRE